MKRLVSRILSWFAKRVILKYRPHVIGITGSYGKTSTKDAIAAVLAEAYTVSASAKSYNNEFGLPFTVLLAPETNRGVVWRILKAKWNGLKLLLTHQPYPTVLVLEMGADKPNDIAELLKLTHVDVGVFTGVGPTHLQRFGSIEAILEEKALLVKNVREHGWAVLNADDDRVRGLAEVVPARIVSYGFQSGVAIRCLDSAVAKDEATKEWGMMAKVACCELEVSLFLPGVCGRHSVYSALAAIAVAKAFHLDAVEVVEGLRKYAPPPGRMRILPGVKRTTLIDDSYNSSPDACTAAIEALREFPAEGARYAVLGDMADLGAATEPAHEAIGKTVVEEEIDFFVAVGERMKHAADEARKQGMNGDRIFTFNDASSAARFVQDRLKPGDVVLFKGSQVSRMERAVKELMAEPENAKNLLVRQEEKWLRTK